MFEFSQGVQCFEQFNGISTLSGANWKICLVQVHAGYATTDSKHFCKF